MADFSRSAWIMGLAQIVFVIFVMGSAVALSNALKPAESDKPALVDFSASGERSSVSASIPRTTSYTPEIRINGVVQSQAQADIACRQVETAPGDPVTFGNPAQTVLVAPPVRVGDPLRTVERADDVIGK